MMTASVKIYDINNKTIQARVFLDTCASANFISEELANRLNLKRIECSMEIGGINGLCTAANTYIPVTFQSRVNDYKKTLEFFIVPSICDSVPEEFVPREKFNIPPNIPLADPEFFKPSKIDMIIGAGTTVSLLTIGKINISKDDNDFFLQKTGLGWVAVGGTNFHASPNSNIKSRCALTDIKNVIEKFWQIEEVFPCEEISTEEASCELHFKKHTRRDEKGRYIVSLPFKDNLSSLGDSRERALKQFHSLQKRFKNDPKLEKEYRSVIEEYSELGHATVLQNFALAHSGAGTVFCGQKYRFPKIMQPVLTCMGVKYSFQCWQLLAERINYLLFIQS